MPIIRDAVETYQRFEAWITPPLNRLSERMGFEIVDAVLRYSALPPWNGVKPRPQTIMQVFLRTITETLTWVRGFNSQEVATNISRGLTTGVIEAVTSHNPFHASVQNPIIRGFQQLQHIESLQEARQRVSQGVGMVRNFLGYTQETGFSGPLDYAPPTEDILENGEEWVVASKKPPTDDRLEKWIGGLSKQLAESKEAYEMGVLMSALEENNSEKARFSILSFNALICFWYITDAIKAVYQGSPAYVVANGFFSVPSLMAVRGSIEVSTLFPLRASPRRINLTMFCFFYATFLGLWGVFGGDWAGRKESNPAERSLTNLFARNMFALAFSYGCTWFFIKFMHSQLEKGKESRKQVIQKGEEMKEKIVASLSKAVRISDGIDHVFKERMETLIKEIVELRLSITAEDLQRLNNPFHTDRPVSAFLPITTISKQFIADLVRMQERGWEEATAPETAPPAPTSAAPSAEDKEEQFKQLMDSLIHRTTLIKQAVDKAKGVDAASLVIDEMLQQLQEFKASGRVPPGTQSSPPDKEAVFRSAIVLLQRQLDTDIQEISEIETVYNGIGGQAPAAGERSTVASVIREAMVRLEHLNRKLIETAEPVVVNGHTEASSAPEPQAPSAIVAPGGMSTAQGEGSASPAPSPAAVATPPRTPDGVRRRFA